MADKKEFVPSPPEFKGDGIAIWKADDKNGKLYLRVAVLGGKAVNCFQYEPKPKVTRENVL